MEATGKTTKESVFMQMHNRTRTGEGSFNAGLQKLFYLADNGNRRKLVKTFPEFFGDEVPEFGIKKEDYSKQIEKAKTERQKLLNALANDWFSKNPITHPLRDYFKKVYIQAYTDGEGIIDYWYSELKTQ